MRRLYIFAIGGTGSRVLKSLTMLLAAGVKPDIDQDYEIVPIIIDPHTGNEDLKRTIQILNNYQEISKDIGLGKGFFNTSIRTLDRLVDSQTKFTGNFTFNLQQVANTRFKDYIDYGQLDESNKLLANLLFSGKSINKRGEEVDLLDLEMDIGFVGNPNIGSVVLNQFKDSKEFKEFASNFNQDDRVFIISSIFGGTGAAGFPTILKNIRGAKDNEEINSKGFLQDAKIGAVTVLPYFNIEKIADSPIQKSSFIAKAKAALYYYKENLTGNNSINALYYIADSYNGKLYKNDPGDEGQKNDAHFVEVASAISVLDFLTLPDSALQNSEGRATKPIYKEFGIKKDEESIKFLDLGISTQRVMNLNLSQLYLTKKYFDEHLDIAIDKQPWSNGDPEIKTPFLSTTFYQNFLKDFLESYNEWLKELEENRRSFKPFNRDSSLETVLNGILPEKGWTKKSFDYVLFDNTLNKIAMNEKYSSKEQKLIKLFFNSTRELLTTKFDHFKIFKKL